MVSLACLAGCAAVGDKPVGDAQMPAAAMSKAATGVEKFTMKEVVRNLVRNGDFEVESNASRGCPPSWGCSMHADPLSFEFAVAANERSNGRFLKVIRVKPEPWALVTQSIPAADLVGKLVRLTVSVNAEELDGGAGPIIILQGISGATSDHRQVLVERQQGWRQARAEILVKPGTARVEFGLLMQGGGSVGFDGVVAEARPAPAP